MNNYQRIALILGVVFTLVIWNSFVSAQDLEQEKRAVLRGLQGCAVGVNDLRPEIERAGLTTKQLQTDTELKFRMAGIKVLSGEDGQKVKDQVDIFTNASFFSLNANVGTGGGGYIYNISVSLLEPVQLMRNGDNVWAVTWQKGYLGITFDLSDIRQKVKDQVDIFINDYLAANPK